jgi:serine/threonine protein kinase
LTILIVRKCTLVCLNLCLADVVLEYVEHGEIKWRDENNQPVLTVDQIRPMIRDVVLGLEYLHFQGIIHRDIKPGNLLISNDGSVKISDFGVSHLAKMDENRNLLPENDLDLAKTAGSPAFFAPEICRVDTDNVRPPITKAIDVWALGITLYCLLFGREPFPGVYGEMELYDKICTVPIEPPPEQESRVDADTKDLLSKLLVNDPSERITLPQVRRHPFITEDLPDPQNWIRQTDLIGTPKVQVTAQEVDTAVTVFAIIRRTLASVKMRAQKSIPFLRPRPATGRVLSGIPVIVPGTPSQLGTKEPTSSMSSSPKSCDGESRKAGVHTYFWTGMRRSWEIIPPTPPPSSKVEAVVPKTGPEYPGRKVPVPVEMETGLDLSGFHLNDDYSNLYYNVDEEVAEESDDEGQLEMRFGRKKVVVS